MHGAAGLHEQLEKERAVPVLAEDEGVEGDEGEERRVLVARQRCRRDQERDHAADGGQRLRLRRKPAAQHHQIPCMHQASGN